MGLLGTIKGVDRKASGEGATRSEEFLYVKREAQRIVSEKLSNRCDEIADTLNMLKEKLENIESNIDWDENITQVS